MAKEVIKSEQNANNTDQSVPQYQTVHAGITTQPDTDSAASTG